MGKRKDEEVAAILGEIEALKRRLDQLGAIQPQEDANGDTLDYLDWVDTQFWPEGATHVTIDKQGGCCWWKLKPVLAPARDYGWKPRERGGELVERYYDSSMPFAGVKWRDSLRAKPEAGDA